MNIQDRIRELAKSSKYQNLLIFIKETGNSKIFRNEIELSSLQYMFLNWIYFYHNLREDLSINKMSKHIYEDNEYADSYTYWKNNTSEDKKKDKKVKTNSLQLVFSSDKKR